MEPKAFIQAYHGRPDISDIPWEDFPEQLQMAGLHFMNDWKEELPLRHVRELSGFDDMAVNDLLVYAERHSKPEEENTWRG